MLKGKRREIKGPLSESQTAIESHEQASKDSAIIKRLEAK